MLTKLLLIIIAIGILYFLIFPKPKHKQSKKKDIENLIECDKCNTFVSSREIITKNHKNFCKDCIKEK